MMLAELLRPVVDQASGWSGALFDLALKGTVLLAFGAGLAMAARRASAAARHLIWAGTIVGLLLVPVLSVVLPAWRILPQWATAQRATVATAAEKPEGPAALPAMVQPEIAPVPVPMMTRDMSMTMQSPMPVGPMPEARPATVKVEAAVISWPAILVLIWAMGAGAALVPILISPLVLKRVQAGSVSLVHSPWERLCDLLRALLGLGRPVGLLKSDRRAIPMTFGILRPKILLPAEAEAWSADRRRMVLLHELAHVKRLDCLTALLARCARAIFWFHPLVWIACWRLSLERERACDDMVLRAGTRSSDYATELLSIASSFQRAGAPYAALAMARPSTLEGRLLAILDGKRNRRKLAMTTAGLIVILMGCVILPLACVRPRGAGEQPKAEDAWGEADRNGLRIRLVVEKQPMAQSQGAPATIEIWNTASKTNYVATSHWSGGMMAVANEWLVGLSMVVSDARGTREMHRARTNGDWSIEGQQADFEPVAPGEKKLFQIHLRELADTLTDDAGNHFENLSGEFQLQPKLRTHGGGEGSNYTYDGVAMGKPVEVRLVGKDPIISGEFGEVVDGLRCKWTGPASTVVAGTKPQLAMLVENVSDQPIIWECGSEATWLVSVPGVEEFGSRVMVKFAVEMGTDTRPATVAEMRTKFGADRGAQLDAHANMPGYYMLLPGGTLRLKGEFPYSLKTPGLYQMESRLARESLMQADRAVQHAFIECPPVVVGVAEKAGMDAPAVDPTKWTVGEWGAAVERAQIRINPEKTFLNPGAAGPNIYVDARNFGQRKLVMMARLTAELQVDGIWYYGRGSAALGESRPMARGNITSGIELSFGGDFFDKSGFPPTFAKGPHKIRVALWLSPVDGDQGGGVRLESNEMTPPASYQLPAWGGFPGNDGTWDMSYADGFRMRLVLPQEGGKAVLAAGHPEAKVEIWNTGDKPIRIATRNMSGGRELPADEWLVGLRIGAQKPGDGDGRVITFTRDDDGSEGYWSRVGNSPSAVEIKPGEKHSFGIRLHDLVGEYGEKFEALRGNYQLRPNLTITGGEAPYVWHGNAWGGLVNVEMKGAAATQPAEPRSETTQSGSATQPGPETPHAPMLTADVVPSSQPMATQSGSADISFNGQVIDDQTGKPIEHFTIQWGWPGVDGKMAWGGMEQSSDRWRDGKFTASTSWETGKKIQARIIAEGYVSEPITPEPVQVPVKMNPVVVRMTRGATLEGFIMDHNNKPVRGAELILAGDTRVDALGSGPDGLPNPKPAARQFMTDNFGHFVITGVSKGQSLVITSPGLVAWRTDVPDPSKVATIRLPEPGAITPNYNIPGAPDKAFLRIELKTWEMPDWKEVSVHWLEEINNGKKPVDDMRMTPGVYDVARIKQLKVGDIGRMVMLDRMTVTCTSGKTTPLSFARPEGAPITGKVVGLKNLPGAFIYVRPVQVVTTGVPPKNENELIMLDGLTCGPDGAFKTETIPPGMYTVSVEAYGPDKFPERSGFRVPDMTASAIVLVPKKGAPDPVTISLETGTFVPDATAPAATAPAATQPQVLIEGAGATGVATLNNDGKITSIAVTNPGPLYMPAKPADILFHGINLASYPAITKPPKLDLVLQKEDATFEEIRAGKVVAGIWIDPVKKEYYLQHDGLGASTPTYYGPINAQDAQRIETLLHPPATGPAARIDAHDGNVRITQGDTTIEAKSIEITPATAPAPAQTDAVRADLEKILELETRELARRKAQLGVDNTVTQASIAEQERKVLDAKINLDQHLVQQAPGTADPVTKDLESMIALENKALAQAQAQQKAGLLTQADVDQQERRVLEANVQLAAHAHPHDGLDKALSQLLDLEEKDLERLKELNKMGVVADAEVTAQEKRVLEAKIRLAAVPQGGEYYIMGVGDTIARPGVYTLPDQKLSLLQAIAAAGGKTASAEGVVVTLIRRDGDKKESTTHTLLTTLLSDRSSDTVLQSNDMVVVAVDKEIVPLQQKKAELESKLKELQTRLAASHPDVQLAQAQLDDVNAQIEKRMAALLTTPSTAPATGPQGRGPEAAPQGDRVSILGNGVRKPGAYEIRKLNAHVTLMDAATLAGGLAADAAGQPAKPEDIGITCLRGGDFEQRRCVSLAALQKDARLNVTLEPNDIILVQRDLMPLLAQQVQLQAQITAGAGREGDEVHAQLDQLNAEIDRKMLSALAPAGPPALPAAHQPFALSQDVAAAVVAAGDTLIIRATRQPEDFINGTGAPEKLWAPAIAALKPVRVEIDPSQPQWLRICLSSKDGREEGLLIVSQAANTRPTPDQASAEIFAPLADAKDGQRIAGPLATMGFAQAPGRVVIHSSDIYYYSRPAPSKD